MKAKKLVFNVCEGANLNQNFKLTLVCIFTLESTYVDHNKEAIEQRVVKLIPFIKFILNLAYFVFKLMQIYALSTEIIILRLEEY